MTNLVRRVIADAELKQKMKDLKKTYGSVPDESATIVELDIRCQTLSDTLDDIVKGYTKYVGERPPIMKATHPVKWNGDFPQRKITGHEAKANICDKTLRKAPAATQEGMANLLLRNAEYLDRAHRRHKIITRSAAEWRRMEREHVASAEFTITDLYSDYKDLIEFGLIRYVLLLKTFGFAALPNFADLTTWDDYRQERRKWKRCKHRFCLNMFPVERDNFKERKPKRCDSKYCSRSCNENEKYARICYEKTAEVFENPTYLPGWFYEEVTLEWGQKRSELREVALPGDELEREINKNKPLRHAPLAGKERPVIGGVIVRRIGIDVTVEELDAEKWRNCGKIGGQSAINNRRATAPVNILE